MKNLALLISLFVSLDVSAAIVTIDPANYAAGTNLTHIADGVGLYEATWIDPVSRHDLAATDCVTNCRPPTSGQRVFGVADQPDDFYSTKFSYEEMFRKAVTGQYVDTGFNVFLAVFDQPTDFVQVVGMSANANPWYLDAWSADGTLLGSCVGLGASTGSCTQTPIGTANPDPANYYYQQSQIGFQSNQNNIAFISVAGWFGPAYVRSFAFDNVAVPLPTTGWLLGLALAGLIGTARRRKN